MCVRTYIKQECAHCGREIDDSTCKVDPCWWQTMTGLCNSEKLSFTTVWVVGCKPCRANTVVYEAWDRIHDYDKEAWFDDDADAPNPPEKPRHHWKNSLPPEVVRRYMSGPEFENWEVEEAKRWKNQGSRKEEERGRRMEREVTVSKRRRSEGEESTVNRKQRRVGGERGE